MLGVELTHIRGWQTDPRRKIPQIENQDCLFYFWPISWAGWTAGSFPHDPPWRNQQEKQRTGAELLEWLGAALDWGGWEWLGFEAEAAQHGCVRLNRKGQEFGHGAPLPLLWRKKLRSPQPNTDLWFRRCQDKIRAGQSCVLLRCREKQGKLLPQIEVRTTASGTPAVSS